MSPSETIRSTLCESATRKTSVSASMLEWMSEITAIRIIPVYESFVPLRGQRPHGMEWFYMRIVVTGSLAYDYIMNFPGYFKDHILPDKVHMLSVSFLVDSMRRMRGGVAGNIAYTLALLGERPLVVATAGQDFGEYRALMEHQGIDAAGIKLIHDEFTASCF